MTEINLTDEEFVTKYVEVAKADGAQAADDWAVSLFDGEVPEEFVTRNKEAVLAALKEANLDVQEVQETPEEVTESVSGDVEVPAVVETAIDEAIQLAKTYYNHL